jgi:lycopene cyclase domain-containing protein
MTYFGFLAGFLVVPLVILGGLAIYECRRERERSAFWPGGRGWRAVFLHVVIAVLYTTPWDNYLVATRVWWYDPELVSGIILGWVPLEEYAFFVLQTLLAGAWLLFLGRRLMAVAPTQRRFSSNGLRTRALLLAGGLWVAAVAVLAAGWRPGTYLALELAWALPPIALQLAFGTDILWHYRKLLGLAVLPLTLYLSLADALAIGYGTWTIDPQQSLGVLLGWVLPVEEFVFFLLTNTLVVFGATLLLAPESHERFRWVRQRWIGSSLPASGVGK